jgi:mRNA interferase MazF
LASPSRGECWLADFGPTVGKEQEGLRPALVISDDRFNLGPAGLVIVLPLTSKDRGYPFHVPIDPPQGGLKKRSLLMADQIRTISKNRLVRHLGEIEPDAILRAEKMLRALLAL